MRIAIGTDHAGYSLKELLKSRLSQEGHEVIDLGTESEEAVDYPDIICPTAELVALGQADRGIVLGGSGQGEAIAANKVPGVRAALCNDLFTARLSREHNNANVLSMGARVVGTELAWAIVSAWLSTPFSDDERHVRRIAKITAVEQARRFPLQEVSALGQSLWYDYILRGELRSGAFRALVRKGITGVTSNPSIFEKSIAGTEDYADDIAAAVGQGWSGDLILDGLTMTDIREAADQLRPVYDLSEKANGYVSIELPPDLAHNTNHSIEAGQDLFHRLKRDNIMIKVPGTAEGVPAVEELIASGVNVNITLLFSIAQYEAVANAYIAGLERRERAGEPLYSVASVASFFVSRIDTAVDAQLEARMSNAANEAERAQLRGLAGKTAIANAKVAYQRFNGLFSGPRWQRLAEQGARPQRLLWASTSTKNPAYRDVLYVEELIGQHTVNTVPPATLDAFLDHGVALPTLERGAAEAELTLAQLHAAGIDLDAVTQQLQTDGIKAFADAHNNLLAALEQKRQELSSGARLVASLSTDALQRPAQRTEQSS